MKLPPKHTRVIRVLPVNAPSAPVRPNGSIQRYQLRAEERIQSKAWNKTVRAHVRAPCVVFARHKCVMDHLHSMFPHAKRIDGTHRDDIPEEGVLLCSIGAASVGLTLTFAALCVFVECSWSAGVQAQCEARIHRIGQESPCEIVYILYDDEDIWASLQRKERITRRMLKG